MAEDTIACVVELEFVLLLGGVSERMSYPVGVNLPAHVQPGDQRSLTMAVPVDLGGAIFERTIRVPLDDLVTQRHVTTPVLPIVLDEVCRQQLQGPPLAPVVNVNVEPTPISVTVEPTPIEITNYLEQPPREIALKRDPKSGVLTGAAVKDA